MLIFRKSRGIDSGIGLPPGELIQRSSPSETYFSLNVTSYGPQAIEERANASVADALQLIENNRVTWIQCQGLHSIAAVRELCQALEVHPLGVEDILAENIRPKLADYDSHLVVVGHTAIYRSDEKIYLEQVSFIIGKNYLISFQDLDDGLFDPVLRRIRENRGRIRGLNAGYLLFALLDLLTDHILATLDNLEDVITGLDETLLAGEQDRNRMQEIFRYKRAVLQLARIVWPTRELASKLETLEHPCLGSKAQVYFRNLADSARRSTERVEHSRLTLQNMQEFYHLEQEHRSNDVMRVLTVIATIFIPVTFIAGVYGMNFDPELSPWNMPELKWRYGYVFCVSLMVSFILSMFIFFKRKKWL